MRKKGKSLRTIKKNLKELRELIDTSPDIFEHRMAYTIETALRWAIEDTVGWPDMIQEAKDAAWLLKKRVRDTMKDLGIMNGWNETPPEYRACKEAGHEMIVENLGRCYNEYSCEICQIKYRVDSSD